MSQDLDIVVYQKAQFAKMRSDWPVGDFANRLARCNDKKKVDFTFK